MGRVQNRVLSSNPSASQILAASAGLALAAALSHAQPIPVLFNGSVNTSYLLPGNWNGGVVPINGAMFYQPIIGAGLTCDIPVTNFQVDAVELEANSRLRLGGGSVLRIRGNAAGVGVGTVLIPAGAQLEMNQSGVSVADIFVDGNGAVIFRAPSGAPGRVLMNGSASNRIFSSSGAGTLQNELIFEGGGSIGLAQTTIDNRGIIRATAGNTMLIQPGGGGTQNRGTLEADGGTLVLRNTTTNVTVGPLTGTLRAVNGGTVQVEGVVSGGILQTSGPTSAIRGVGGTLISAALDNAIVQIPSSTLFNVQGTFLGTPGSEFRLSQSGPGQTELTLVGSSPVVFSGPSIILSNSFGNRVYSSSGAATLTLASGSAIRGGGDIGINQTPITVASGAVISADAASMRLQPGGSGFVNGGTIEARNGGTLILRNTFNNTGGSVVAQNGSTVDFDNGSHTGGTLRALGTGVLLVNGGSPFIQNFVLAEGEFRIAEASLVRIGGVNQIDGSLTLNSGASGNCDLAIVGAVTFGGTGQIRANASASNRLYSESGSGLVTLNIPFRGAGQLGIGQTPLAFNSLVDNDTAGTLLISPGGTGVTNAGTIRQSGAGLTQIRGRIFNESGRVEATGPGNVDLDGCHISGGILADTGAGAIIVDSVAPLIQSVTLEAGELRIAAASSARFTGAHVINGSVTLNQVGTSAVCDLIIAGTTATTFGGTGQIRASDSPNNRFYSESGSGTIVLNLPFRGAGQLGVGISTLVLNSLVDNDTAGTLLVSPGGAGTDNNSVIRQSGTGLLQIRGRIFNEQGRLEVTGTGNLDLDGCNLTGGILADTGAGTFIVDGQQPTLQDFTLQSGEIAMALGGSIRAGGLVTINGAINFVGTVTSDLIVIGNGTTTFAGTGQIFLNHPAHRFYSESGSGSITIAPGLTIRGTGQLGVGLTAITNQGLILADLAGGLNIAGNGIGFTNEGEIRVSGAGSISATSGPFTQAAGLIQIDAGRLFNRSNGTVIQTGGTILANDELQVVSDNFQLQGGILRGDGLVDSIVTQTGGTIDPSPSLTIEGGLTQNAASTLRIDLNGTGSTDADLVSVTGPAALNGALRVVIGPNYVITPGDQFVIVNSTGARTGTFSSLVVEPAQLGIDASMQYLSNSVVLTIDGCVICGYCNYDYNRDENVDLLDAQQMAQVFVGLIQPEANWLDGDLNLDENADLTDAQLLARAIVQGLCEL